ncbi:MAG: ankyrin repeat domain-containing protein [Planctomycetes bacterium]|nr:ankyrin repeat domain-containing protein [Planctomycetota bacterium]
MQDDPTPFAPLPFDAAPDAYERLARRLVDGHRAGDAAALEAVRRWLPRFRTEGAPWLPRDVPPDAIARTPFELDDARMTVARAHDFADQDALVAWVRAVADGGAVARFERAVESVVSGGLATLCALLARDPELVRARSTRRTPFDPPVHGATLLHYVAANGVEGQRQRVPANAVEIARTLLEAGAEVDALADLYGCRCATLGLLVSSSHPADAGLDVALTELLLDQGAAIEGCGESWGTPLRGALLFGQTRVAATLARRGARLDLVSAAGLGRADDVAQRLGASDALARHLALALAAQLGHADVVRLLLDAGEDPDRYNPPGGHAHTTPLHQAALNGHRDVVELLVRRGARLDLRDTIYDGTPLDWARHAGRDEIAALMRAGGAE